MDGSGAITFGSFKGLFRLTGFVTTSSILVAFLMCHCKKDVEKKAATKLDGPNQQKHGQQEENGHIQDTDQGNEEHGDCKDIDNQETTSVPHIPNTNRDLTEDFTPNNDQTATN